MGLFTKVFGTYSQRELKSIYPIVDKITALEDEYKQLTPVEKLLANCAESGPPGLPQGFGRTMAWPGEIVLPGSSERLSISCG